MFYKSVSVPLEHDTSRQKIWVQIKNNQENYEFIAAEMGY